VNEFTEASILSICIAAVAIVWIIVSAVEGVEEIRANAKVIAARSQTIRERGYPPVHCDADGDPIDDFYNSPEEFQACGPCNGNCNQGRACQARAVDGGGTGAAV
jgi:hypothetical protein